MAFKILEKAFGRVNRGGLWELLGIGVHVDRKLLNGVKRIPGLGGVGRKGKKLG